MVAAFGALASQAGGTALSNDTSLASLTANGDAVEELHYEVSNGITSVEIAITATEAGASFTGLSGFANNADVGANAFTRFSSSLSEGDNPITFTVHAPDGTTQDYTLTVRRLTVGEKEKTEVSCIADVAGSLRGKFFLIQGADNLAAVWFNNGAKKEKIAIEILSPAAIMANGVGEGRYFIIKPTPSAPVRMAFWFCVDGEEAPPSLPGGVAAFQVDLEGDDSQDSIAVKLQTVMEGQGLACSVSGAVITYECAATGEIDPDPVVPEEIDGKVAISVLVQGRASANQPVVEAGRFIQIDYSDDDTAAAIASAITVAFNSDDEFTVSDLANGGDVVFEDKTAGARTDATDGDTGFDIDVITQGVDPS